jgi:outer membrane protein assembly factor BamB
MCRWNRWMLGALGALMALTSGCNCSGGSGSPDGGGGRTDAGQAAAHPADVLMHRRNPTRDGVYVDPLMTKTALANMHVDSSFNATTSSNSYAQVLFMENGPDGGDTLFVATEQNDVFALDANSGKQVWTVNVGAPASSTQFCGGSINPYGISGTPAIDPDGRTLYFNAMLATGNSGRPTNTIFALSLDTGKERWKIDVDTAVAGFDSTIENERGAVLLFNGTLYVVYGGLDGDCGPYRGWILGVATANPGNISSWHTAAPSGSGIWGPSGAATDGTSIFVATTNTNGPHPTVWDAGHSEAVIRLTPGLQFTESAANFFTQGQGAANNNQDWYYNDVNDLDLGSSGLVLFDAPGATPSKLAFAVGKTSYAYLLDRSNLGGIGLGLSSVVPHTDGQVFGSLLAYNTAKPATYVSGRFNVSGTGFCTTAGADITVLQVTHANPPQLKFAWCGVVGGDAAPIVSTTDGLNDAVLWTYGASGDETVRAYDADTGTLLYTSPGLAGSTHWISPIIAKGRLYVAQNGTVTALTVR